MAIRVRLVVVLVLVVLGVWTLTGCASTDGDALQADVSSQSAPQAMPSEERTTLPEGFPIEVPVMDGAVTESEVGDPGLGPWMYLMDSPHERDAVAEWYRQAYEGRSWQVADEASGATEHVLVLAKGAGAWSTVTVTTADHGCRIECWTGIGVPVPPEALPAAKVEPAEV